MYGECVPFDPDNPIVPTYGREGVRNTDGPGPNKAVNRENATQTSKPVVEGRPEWYDPIFLGVFETLLEK